MSPQLDQEIQPSNPPLAVYQELNSLFDKMESAAQRIQDIAGEFGFTHVKRSKGGCQVMVTSADYDVTVRRSD